MLQHLMGVDDIEARVGELQLVNVSNGELDVADAAVGDLVTS